MRQLLDIDLRLLRIFRAIVEAQGLSGAQILLNLSQSRISASLAELESRLGARLCRRGRSGFALTEAGQSVYEASHELFESVDRFCNRAGSLALNLKRTLKLGAVDALVTNREMALSRALEAFQKAAPSVIIDLMIAGPEDLEAQLVAGRRDMIIVPSLSRRPELSYVALIEERQSLYCARGHRLFDMREPDAWQELSQHPIVARGYLHSEDLKRLGHRQAHATVEMMEAQLMLILSGRFIGYLPAHYARAWVETGELRCLGEDVYSYESTFYAVGQSRAAESPLSRRFLTLLVAAVKGEAVIASTGRD
jgi:LysR family transcriptional regulator, transcriptional activator for bauABCD operon